MYKIFRNQAKVHQKLKVSLVKKESIRNNQQIDLYLTASTDFICIRFNKNRKKKLRQININI
jgi:hypothetical protein